MSTTKSALLMTTDALKSKDIAIAFSSFTFKTIYFPRIQILESETI